MRLLSTSTLTLEEFTDSSLPKYAILSHTWREEEVSFQDIQTGKAEHKKGYAKLQGSSRIAAAAGLKHIWIDTCCIDKSSSAELSEAINSMFRYYHRAAVCLVYLDDLKHEAAREDSEPDRTSVRQYTLLGLHERLAKCRWFTRGWCLQELLAPENLKFFTEDWVYSGEKKELASLLSRITGIDEPILRAPQKLLQSSVAARMSWASKRQTTRVEDIAYCLLGIFNVNMPLLYGEGKKAFERLQESILENYVDHSLLAWSSLNSTRGEGVLAESPGDFALAGSIVPLESLPSYETAVEPYAMTNKGLQIQLPIIRRKNGEHIAVLACHHRSNFIGPIGVHIKAVPGNDTAIYRRLLKLDPIVVKDHDLAKAKMRSIYILKGEYYVPKVSRYCWLRLPRGIEVDDATHGPGWDMETHTMNFTDLLVTKQDCLFVLGRRNYLINNESSYIQGENEFTKTGVFCVSVTLAGSDEYSAAIDIFEPIIRTTSEILKKHKELCWRRRCIPSERKRTSTLQRGHRETVIANISWRKRLEKELLVVDVRLYDDLRLDRRLLRFILSPLLRQAWSIDAISYWNIFLLAVLVRPYMAPIASDTSLFRVLSYQHIKQAHQLGNVLRQWLSFVVLVTIFVLAGANELQIFCQRSQQLGYRTCSNSRAIFTLSKRTVECFALYWQISLHDFITRITPDGNVLSVLMQRLDSIGTRITEFYADTALLRKSYKRIMIPLSESLIDIVSIIFLELMRYHYHWLHYSWDLRTSPVISNIGNGQSGKTVK